ncbi:hypothetical protein [Kitasatospora aureofaciens]
MDGPLVGNWEGEDAKAALAFLAKTEQQLNVVKMEADTAALVLNTVADRMYQAQTNLTNAVNRAVDAGLDVSADGVVSLPPEGKGEHNDPEAHKARQQLGSEMKSFQDRINTALKDAQAASDQGNTALGRLSSNALDPAKVNGALAGAKNAAAAAMQDLGLVDPYIPDGKDPEKSAAWWKGLTPEQQDAYLALHPDQIGRLDGLPTTVRDEANRLVLDEKLDAYRSGKPGDFGIDEDEYKSRINAMEEIGGSWQRPTGTPRTTGCSCWESIPRRTTAGPSFRRGTRQVAAHGGLRTGHRNGVHRGAGADGPHPAPPEGGRGRNGRRCERRRRLVARL